MTGCPSSWRSWSAPPADSAPEPDRPPARPPQRPPDRDERVSSPGAPRPKPLRRPGPARGRDDHPPLVDLLALAFCSTSHRPSCPRARRAMPRCRPGSRLPGPFPSRFLRRPGRIRGDDLPVRTPTSPSQLGWLAAAGTRAIRARPPGEPFGRPRLASVVLNPVCRLRFTSTCPPPERGTGAGLVSVVPSWSKLPAGATDRFPVPVGVALSGTQHTLANASPQVKGYFSVHRVLPRTSSLPPRSPPSSTVHPPFVHKVVHMCAAQRALRLTTPPPARLNVGRDHDLHRLRAPARRDHHHSVVHVDRHVHV